MRAVVFGALLVPSIATAHIQMTSPTERTDAFGEQKAEHCGTPGWVRGDHPTRTTTFAPGSTITVKWTETVNHPGYFRIAFQPSGDVFRIPPAGNGPPAGYPDEDLTGQTDATTGSIILKDRIADGTTQIDVTLPNMECANCTLQLIQVMTDKPPYTVDAASDDVYFRCADITLGASAPDAGPQPMGDAGTDPTPPPSGGGGCDATGGAGFAALVGLLGLRRRRRS